jgi:hypothetical protein
MSTSTRTNRDVLKAAGYETCEEREGNASWQIWRAELPGPARTFVEYLVFLNAAATWPDVERVESAVKRHASQYTVIVRPGSTVASDLARLRSQLGRENVRTVSEFLFNVIRRGLGPPLATSDAQFGLKYFVDPWLAVPDSEEPQGAVGYLTRWLRGTSATTSNVGVLLAPAGTGKTTVVTEVFRRLGQQTSTESIPILVARDQWVDLPQQHALELADVWSVGARTWYPRATVGADLLDYCLSFGSMCPVFDGLDELCGLFPEWFNANETVGDLLENFEGGRVLITTRSRYWHENITSALRARVVEFELQPFDAKLRDKYVEIRFPDSPDKAKRSKAILDRLSGITHIEDESNARLGAFRVQPERFDKLPYVVAFACESADTSTDESSTRYGGLLAEKDPLRGLLMVYFDREKIRQQFRYSVESQFQTFSTLATEFDEWFDATEIELSLPSGVGAFDDRLLDHGALEMHERRYRIRFKFVRDYLLGSSLASWLQERTSGVGAARALRLCTVHETEFADRCAELVLRLVGDSLWDSLRKARSDLSNSSERAGLTQVALRTARLAVGANGTDVVRKVLRVFGAGDSNVIDGLDFAGQVGGLDLRGITIRRCHFNDVDFAHCTFDEATSFENCRIEGRLSFTNCNSMDLVSYSDDCEISAEARGTINRFRRPENRFPVTADDLRVALRDLMRRFQRGAAFVTRREDGIRRAMVKQSSFGVEIVDACIQSGTLARFGPNGDSGLRVEDTHSARMFMDNGLAVGVVLASLERLERRVAGDRK